MIEVKGLKKSYDSLHVLKGIDLKINRGEIVSVVGASGAGKSTLLHLLGTLDKADQGKIVIDDIDVTSLSSKKLSQFRNRKIGFVISLGVILD